MVLGLTLSLFWAAYAGLSLLVGHWRGFLRPLLPAVTGWVWAVWVIYNSRPDTIVTILPLAIFFLIIAGLFWLPLITAFLWSKILKPKTASVTVVSINNARPAPWVNWILGGIFIFAAILRITNIKALPIFLDEGTHIRAGLAAQSGKLDESSLFTMAYNGRALHGWLLSAIFNVNDSVSLLELARVLSAICGLMTVLICFKLGEKLFSAKAGLLAAGLWTIIPFTVWHERMALVDPLMTTCTALTIYFSLRLREIEGQKRWVILGYATLVGLSMTIGVLTKTTALLVFVVPILAVLILSHPRDWSKMLPRLGPVYAVFWITTIPVINLYKGRWLGEYQGGEYTSEPTPVVLMGNLAKVGEWVYAYFTLPILIIFTAGIILAFRHYWRISLWLFLLILFPLLAMTLVAGSSFFPRYLLFLLVPLVALAAGGLDQAMNWLIKRKKASWGLALLALLCLPVLSFNYQTIFSPAESALPAIDREGYIEGWPAGSGLGEVSNYLITARIQFQKSLTVIAFDGLTFDCLSVQMHQQKGLRFLMANREPYKLQGALYQALRRGPTYLVMVEPLQPGLLEDYKVKFPDIQFNQVLSVPKTGNRFQLVTYELKIA
jgi:4-amino-4-deoxy-L-arabinose transferase-like glycosyltransferase